jgi:hypothetical protein
MGKINLKEIGNVGGDKKHPNTRNEYEAEVTFDRVDYVIEKIMSADQIWENKVCFVFGMGAHTLSTYFKLHKIPGVEVIWYHSLFPFYFAFLRPIIASYAGLVCIKNKNNLSHVFKTLIDSSMAGIYIVDKSYKKDFIFSVTNEPLPKNYEYGIKKDKQYFLYIVDADNYESKTGIYEFVSYGIEVPKELII